MLLAGLVFVALSINIVRSFRKDQKTHAEGRSVAKNLALMVITTTCILWFLNQSASPIDASNWIFWSIVMMVYTFGVIMLSITAFIGIVAHTAFTSGGEEANKRTITLGKMAMLFGTMSLILVMCSVVSEIYLCTEVKKGMVSTMSAFNNFATIMVWQWLTTGVIGLWLNFGRKTTPPATA